MWVAFRRQDYRRGKLTCEQVHRFEALPQWTWDPLEDGFEIGFGHLETYVAKNAHARVPQKYTVNGFALGAWTNTRRQDYQKHKLTDEEACRFEALPGWSWDRRDEQFETSFRYLEEYVAENGHARVPTDYTFGGCRLGSWVNSRRQDHRKGNLTKERIRRFEALHGWAWNLIDIQFETNFCCLKAFVAKIGHARVPDEYSIDGMRLGKWVGRRRQDYRKGTLAGEHERLLESMPGWMWNVLDNQFEAMFAQLEVYVAKNGHARVPKSYEVDGFTLGGWVSKRRHDYQKRRLTDEQVRRFDALPGWSWDRRAEQFELGYGYLEAFVGKNGHTHVPRGCRVDGFSLGEWVSGRHEQYRKGKLPRIQISQLEGLKGWNWGGVARGERTRLKSDGG
jgi:hypothetical protein